MMAADERPPSGRLTLAAYAPELRAAIDDFNRRLDAGGATPEFRLNSSPGPLEHAGGEGHCLHEERWFALDGDVVRGGVFLQVQPFVVDGEVCTVANIQLPLSEGIVDRKFAHVGMWLVKQVVRRYPRCFALGMGGEDRPLPSLLRAMGWSVWSVPFLFRIGNVARAVREIPALGPAPRRRLLSSALRWTGAGLVGRAAWSAVAAWRTRSAPRVTVTPVRSWDGWADVLWAEARAAYAVAGVRDACTLADLFPVGGGRFRPFRIDAHGQPVGWFVVSRRQMQGNAHFGNLTVGSIIDGLTLPGHEVSAVRAATTQLLAEGADVVVTNQSHPDWVAALRAAAFRGTRSNYVLAASPKLLPGGSDLAGRGLHFTRGDGDGRIFL